MSSISDNKRIAKNTIYLYIRTAVVLLVSLYTSRVILQLLGAEELGIYNVVGGIVALMSFLQSGQANATSRFITFELGKNSGREVLRKVFSVCMTIHIGIAILTVILGETIGLWIVTHWTDIPLERQTAAMWVYQFAILVFCIQIIRVPYDSVIIAHERMSTFAYMSILEVALQLGMVFLLMALPGDSLILYSGSLVLIAAMLLSCYYIYVRRHFEAYRFSLVWDKEYSMRILSFSGWTLLGSGANTMTQQGTSLLMNNFVGLIANAALGFANQVNVAVGKFVHSFSTAFTPQIVKLYAQKDYVALHTLMNRSSKFSFVLCYLFALPLIANMGFILSLWLGNDVPNYTEGFCQMILICTIIDATTRVYNITITATGIIRNYQIVISLSFLLDLLCCFVLLTSSVNPVLVFGSRIVTRGIVNMIIGLIFIKKYVSFDIGAYFKDVILKIIITVIVSAIPVALLSYCSIGWIRLLSTTAVSTIIICLSSLFLIMSSSERKVVLNKINCFLNK